MSKNPDDDPVTGKLCKAYRTTIQEQINGLKKTIYVSSLAMTTVIVVVQLILTLTG